MQCSQCQHENLSDALFCEVCGAQLERWCSRCQTTNRAISKFCRTCGTPLETSALESASTHSEKQSTDPEPEPLTADAERRQLTVMFCDLADSTKLSSQLDPEDLRDVIRAYQSTSSEVIERYDGYIAQHLGDGLMVYFGWPQAHEDDAQRAVHAGLGIIDAMQSLNAGLQQEKGIRLTVRVGIHTGLVVVGEIGQGASQEHLALGETPNVASRIESMAEPDTVIVSAATYQLIQGYFVCADLGQHTLKGVDGYQQVYRVMRAGDSQSRLDAAATRGLTPLVGREPEVALLLERWQQVKDGQGQVIVLSGEAGIGKSRLLQVVKDHVGGETHTLLECRSSPYYQNTALYPITDMLQHLLRWRHDDTPQAKLDTLEQMLRQSRLEFEETVPLFANLLSLAIPEDRYPPLALSTQRQRQKTLETFVAMLLQLTEQQPVLFILEDLHWTDPSTLELLELLIDQTPTASICCLLTCRPTFQPSWGLRTHLTPVALNRLSRNQIADMAERVAGGRRLPEEVLQQIVEKTDGVPLFVEEMTKAVLESGAVKEVNRHYELTSPLTSLTIPATLQDSLMARLDRLVTAKAVAQYAAVIGRQFSYELLQAVSQVDATTLQRELGRLVEAELVYQRGLPPQATYTFKHALVQDTAYQSLLKRTRQQHHQKIAQVLEKLFPATTETQPELLAHHYTEAGLFEQAVVYWKQAGQSALERSANGEAVSHLSRGLEVLGEQPDSSERAHRELALHIALGGPLIATKGYGSPEIVRSTTRALELVEQVGDTEQRFPLLYRQWVYHLVLPDCPTTRTLGEEFLNHAERQGDPALALMGHRILGVTQFSLGEFTDARGHLEQTLSLYDPERHRTLVFRFAQDPQVACQAFLSLVLWLLGYPQQATRLSHDVLAKARALEHINTLAYALFYGGELLALFRRDLEAVEQHTQALTALSEEQGLGFWETYATAIDGWSQTLRGHGEHGLPRIAKGVADLQATGAGYFHPFLLTLQAEAYAKNGQALEGLRLLDKALTLVDATAERVWEAEMYRLTGELLQHAEGSGRWTAWTPETCFQKALDVARHQRAKSLELRAATSLARLWQQQGKSQDAYELLKPVYEWFTEGLDTADLKDAKALVQEFSR